MADLIEVKTGRGVLRGERAGPVAVFRGIPYAEAPVGERRFQPPRPAGAWDGVRDARRFGPACPQLARTQPGRPPFFGGLFGPGDHGTSEDCLTLNVWTPAADGDRRPVMVFIHGGAFRIGSGTAPTYDGARLAGRGEVVVVTLNYRLGVLGFLHAPELGAVNLGLRDQVAALSWVAEEIAAFGGDPGDVTLFGESAGAKSIECLLAAPAARGLFHRAILQSTYDPPLDAASAEELTARLTQAAGLSRMDQLRTAPVEALLGALERVQAAGGPDLFGSGLRPVVDGEFLPQKPLDAARQGASAPVPLVLGTNRDEARLFGAAGPGAFELDPSELRRRLGQAAPGADPAALAEGYRAARASRGWGSEPIDLWLAFQTDRMFRQPSIALAEAHRAAGHPVWMYLFSWPSPAAGGLLGSCHALELPFVFGTLDGPTSGISGTGPEASALAERVQREWLSFAHRGAPGPEWPPYHAPDRLTLLLDRPCRVVSDPEAEERRMWSSDLGGGLAPALG